MNFIRHVGKHGDRKIALIFREIPGEPHMCLVTYPETLNQHIHDPLMQCIESDIGQHSENLADALNRSYAKDGRPILGVLHSEGKLKKVNTENIVMTPAPNTNIKLVDLNKMLDEMKQGEEAVKKMAAMDKSMGMQSAREVAQQMRGQPEKAKTTAPVTAASTDVLGDAVLAKQRLEQSTKMNAEGLGLIAEANRLLAEAQSLDPSLAPAKAKATRKPKLKEVTVMAPAPAAKKARKSRVVTSG